MDFLKKRTLIFKSKKRKPNGKARTDVGNFHRKSIDAIQKA